MGKPKYIMSPSELQGLKSEEAEIRGVLRQLSEGAGAGTRAESAIDKGRLRKQAEMYHRKIQEHTPKRATGATKDKLAKEAKRLETQIKQGMPTREEMWNLKKHPGAPHKNLSWEERNQARIQRWKQIQRRLEPGDSTASNIEKLRRAK